MKAVESHEDQEIEQIGYAERLFRVKKNDESYYQTGKSDNGQEVIQYACPFASQVKGWGDDGISRAGDLVGDLLIGGTGHPEGFGHVDTGSCGNLLFDVGDGDGIEDIAFSDAVEIGLAVNPHLGCHETVFAFTPGDAVGGLLPGHFVVDVQGAEEQQDEDAGDGEDCFTDHDQAAFS
jgi:hypothetical protein